MANVAAPASREQILREAAKPQSNLTSISRRHSTRFPPSANELSRVVMNSIRTAEHIRS